ncbi:MAG: hypothetical protein MR629_05685, partial [Helicobacter sp.]|nr:hypothetical protein [Helicobacter sp.]
MRNTTTYSPKFVSTIAALSLCVSSAVADHSGDNWQINGGSGSNHTGNSDAGYTTTITDLTNGIITTKSDANGPISSLIIKGTINNNNNPILEVGNQDNNSIVNVPTITIEEGATLNRTIQNGSQGWNIIFRGGSTIGSFENKGTISSGKKAGTVYLLTDEQTKNGQTTKGGQTVVRNFTNKGTIKAIESEDVNAALRLQGAKIETFKNEKDGLISATGGAIAIQIESNKGENNANGYYDGSIGTFINEGTISAGERAVSLAHATITSFDNQGTIKSEKVGIAIGSQNTTITHLKNSGVIEITNGNGAGIALRQLNTEQQNQSKPIYGTIENTGTIKGGDYGVFIEGGSINNLKNSGTIEGNKDGIAFFNAGGPLKTTINNLEIEQGIVKGGENGINLSKNNGNNDQTVVGNLTIAQGATVEGVSGSGLVLGKDGSSSDKYQLTGKIQVNGTLKGTTAGITNKGQLGSNEGKDVIVIGSNGKIEGGIVNSSNGRKGRNGGSISGNIVNNSNSDLRITNNDKASFKGNITNNGNGTLAIDNQGKTGNNTVITNNGSGEIKIKDWKLENQDGSGNGNLKTVQFEGNGNITLEKLTISETNTDITKVANAIQGSQKAQAVAHTQVQTNGGNGAVTITGDLLRGLVANIDGSKTAAAALNRTLIATATARATFLDT